MLTVGETLKKSADWAPPPVCSRVEPTANRFLASSGEPSELDAQMPTLWSPLPFMTEHTANTGCFPGGGPGRRHG